MKTEIGKIESIRELKEVEAEALRAYHKIALECQARTKIIREKRGTKLRVYENDGYEEGRSMPPRDHGKY